MTAGRVLLGTLVATSLVVWPTVPAAAHTQAIASWPASGQVLTEMPERVTVAYSTEVQTTMARVEVGGPAARSVVDGDPVVVGQVVTQALVPDEEPGVYGAYFGVVGDDGHLVEGYFEFTVDPDGVETANPAGPEPDLPLGDEDVAAPDATYDAADESEDGSGTTLLLTGLAGAALLVLAIRIVGRRRRG